MMAISLEQRIKTFAELGNVLTALLNDDESNSIAQKHQESFHDVVRIAQHHNGWFDEQMVREAINNISSWLNEKSLTAWLTPYLDDIENTPHKSVGTIMAGNIPLVGFHDFLCVLIAGHRFEGKISSKDALLPRFVAELILDINPDFKPLIHFTENRFEQLDAVIATGSNNSSRYFEYYFGKYPNIIRKNRNSVAIITGNETKEELTRLGEDIFTYFGLGCRNVTKLYVPKGYEFPQFFEAIETYSHVMQNKKYMNNYEYNRTVYLLNKEDGLLDNNFVILKPDHAIGSPIGTLFYEYYDNIDSVLDNLDEFKDQIQCIVGSNQIPFGDAQKPQLNDYADNVDTIKFLSELH